MSQKTVKRSRRHTEEEEVNHESKNAKSKEENSKNVKEVAESETNGVKEENGLKTPPATTNGEGDNVRMGSPKRIIETRSRSSTPLKKNLETTKNNEVSGDSETISLHIDDSNTDINASPNNKETKSNEAVKEENGSEKQDNVQINVDSAEAEPLIEKDEEEIIPELQYDENDIDIESEGSPSRCKTRRSQTRHMSTPKTPKLDNESKVLYIPMERLPEDNASGRSTPKKVNSSSLESNVDSESQPDENVDLDNSDSYSSVSFDNVSTRAVAGSDVTRNVDFTYQDSAMSDDNSTTSTPIINPNRSLADTLRGLSSRRTIRPLNSDYRKIALHNTIESKGDIYANYESVQRVTPGLKRKNRSRSPEDDEVKRFKRENTGLFSYISSPILSHFKNKSSTPKLISFERKQSGFAEPVKPQFKIGNDEQQKKWCSIM